MKADRNATPAGRGGNAASSSGGYRLRATYLQPPSRQSPAAVPATQASTEQYRAAHAGSSLPRAIVKMGHWHTLRGFFRGNVLTFGTFLTELAAANGMGTVVASTYVVNSPDAWRNSTGVVERIADAVAPRLSTAQVLAGAAAPASSLAWRLGAFWSNGRSSAAQIPHPDSNERLLAARFVFVPLD